MQSDPPAAKAETPVAPLAPSLAQGSRLWLEGIARSGKTRTLVQQICQWVDQGSAGGSAQPDGNQTSGAGSASNPRVGSLEVPPPPLIFAATGDNRLVLMDALTTALGPGVPLTSTTPLGFFRSEVLLFWPLVGEPETPCPLPLFLRSETEQELATRLWRDRLPALGALQTDSAQGVNETSITRLVRRLLDLLTLAAAAGIPLTHLVPDAALLASAGLDYASPQWWHLAQQLLQDWQGWCAAQGLLTYGLVCDLYGRCLLPHPTYRQHLKRRFPAVFADDVDEYPALAAQLFRVLVDGGATGVFTFNEGGSVRLGFGADPEAFRPLAQGCQCLRLAAPPDSFALLLGDTLTGLVQEGVLSLPLPGLTPATNPLGVIQTTTRAQLLRRTAEIIAQGIHHGHLEPQDIAIITPGTDAIARYALVEILAQQGMTLQPLAEQRSLVSVPLIRALLTLLALVYPGLGRWVDREQVAEMLVVLSLAPRGQGYGLDPVRAGLLVDHCYRPDLDCPQLLDLTAFPRWDRVGFQGAQVYQGIRHWIQEQQQRLSQPGADNPVQVLDQAIQRFLWQGSALGYDQLAALRELLETAQHYWTVAHRLGEGFGTTEVTVLVQRFIHLLRQGTITANPYPAGGVELRRHSITLATLFQYRLNRCQHRWQFWLDVGSPSWLTRGRGLWGASLFLSDRRAPTPEPASLGFPPGGFPDPLATQGADSGSFSPDADPGIRAEGLREGLQLEALRLQQTVVDLLGRATERVYLCHSELSLGGQDQFGPLLPLVYGGQVLPEAEEDV